MIRGEWINMKKQNLIWVLPVILNVMAFTKRFLYNSIVMFLISFVVFFVYLYVDFSKRPNFRKSWNIIAGDDVYINRDNTKIIEVIPGKSIIRIEAKEDHSIIKHFWINNKKFTNLNKKNFKKK